MLQEKSFFLHFFYTKTNRLLEPIIFKLPRGDHTLLKISTVIRRVS